MRLEWLREKETVLVDTIPSDVRESGSVNLGFEIVRRKTVSVPYHWKDKLSGSPPEVLLFNVFYPTHTANVAPYLRRNGIEPRKELRSPRDPWILVGGQGVGETGLLSGIADEIYTGELDLPENETEIVSEPVIKGGKAVVELTRGCRRACRFCEYGCKQGGPYREKSLELVGAQLDDLARRGIRDVNFLSANLAGYRDLDGLLELAEKKYVRILNADSCVADMPRLYGYLDRLPKFWKLGIESFDEETRARVGKPLDDERLEAVIDRVVETASGIHFYLIFGLPGDRYDRWLEWLEILAAKRRRYTHTYENLFGEEITEPTKAIRFEFNLTNFEPCLGTPFEDAAPVDFRQKEKFLEQWGETMIRLGFFSGEKMDYGNSGGRIGRKEGSYRLLLELKRGGEDVGLALADAFPNGVGRSISDAEVERFFETLEKERE